MADTAEETERLIELMARHSIAEFEFRDEKRSLRIVNGVVSAGEDQGADLVEERLEVIGAPSVGTFRIIDRQFPFSAEAGEILGFVTSGRLRLPVTAPSRGTLLHACHPDHTPVGYGTALFHFRPDTAA